jgi:hypothetical protein
MDKFKNFIKSLLLFTFFFTSVVSAPSIQTNKQNYQFGETVLIYGSGFPHQEVAIQINNPNVVPIFVNQSYPNQDGNFTISYLISDPDPIYIIEGTYIAYASSQSESAQTTFTVTSATVDTTPPTFSGSQTNETQPGKPCNFTLIWNDNKALHPLGRYIFSTDNSGSWMNASSVNFVSTPQTVSYITNLRSTEGLVKWRYYASDNSSNWVASDTYEINVVTTVPCNLQKVNIIPRCSDGSSEDCEPSEKITVNATYSGDCPNPAYIQVNANGTGCYICDQDRDTCDDDICNITGITVNCPDSPCLVNWTIPSTVPAECQGKTMNATYSSLNSNYPCRLGNQKKDEVTPTGSFIFYLAVNTPTTTSPGGDGGGGTTTSTTTTVVTTTSPTTTSPQTTTTHGGITTTTVQSGGVSGSSTYWIIIIVIIAAVVGVFVWLKYFRSTEESAFERLKQKWNR